MLFHLVKKDILLVKKYLIVTMLVVLGFPLLVMAQVPQFLGFNAFLIISIFSQLLLYQYVSMTEMKSPKATALLCASPYPREMLVKARYVFLLLMFAFCTIAYNLVAALITDIRFLTGLELLWALVISTILISIYAPIQYKFGFEKTRYVLTITAISTPFILPPLLKADIGLNLSGWSSLPVSIKYLILTGVVVVVLFISITLSARIYLKKDLL